MSPGLPGWLGDVHGLLARLRRAGFKLGVGEEARVLWLLSQLRDAPAAPQTVPAMALWLGPICCTSARQQALFADELARWAAEHGALQADAPAQPAAAAPLPAPVAAVQRAARSNRWLLGGGITLMLGLLLLLGLWMGRADAPGAAPLPQPRPTGQPASGINTDALARLALAAAPALGLALFLLWQRQRPQALARRFSAMAVPGRRVGLGAARPVLFAPGALSHHFQALRRHHEVPSNRIDVLRSLRATVRAGGRVQLQLGTQRRLPDYLVMVERLSLTDHFGALADSVLRRLAEEQVPCTCYEFHGDPRRSRQRGSSGIDSGGAGRPEGPRGVAELADLAALHGDHPLLLFTEAERFFIGAGEVTQPWVNQLLAWPLALIFTPKPRDEWAARERALQALGFVLLPATPAGIAAFADLLRAGSAEPAPAPAGALAAPLQLLAVRPDRWVRQTPPSPREIEQLLAALAGALGPVAFELLCAAAVFPAVNAEVTLWLADALGPPGRPLLDEESFGRLARLPWLRRGSLPDWLRLALISRLGQDREARVRQLCLHLLQPRGAAGRGFELEIHAADQRTWLATLLAVLQQDEASVLRDAVFLGFVRREQRAPLALQLPGELSRLLRPPRLGGLERAAIAATVVATPLLWAFDAQLLMLLQGAAGWLLPWLLAPLVPPHEPIVVMMAKWLSARLALPVDLRQPVVWAGITAVLLALGLWHVAVLLRRAAPLRTGLWAARISAVLALQCAWLAWPVSTMGVGAGLAYAALAALLVSLLPPRPVAAGQPPVDLAALTQRGGWGLTSVAIAFWLALLYSGFDGLAHWLDSPDQATAAASLAVMAATVFGALVLAVAVAGYRLRLGTPLMLASAGAACAAAALCIALGLAGQALGGGSGGSAAAAQAAVQNNPAVQAVSSGSAGVAFYNSLGLPFLVAAAWGAVLALWLAGLARPRWLAMMALLALGALFWAGALVAPLQDMALQPKLLQDLLMLPVLPVAAVFVGAVVWHSRRVAAAQRAGGRSVAAYSLGPSAGAVLIRRLLALALLLLVPIGLLFNQDTAVNAASTGYSATYNALVLLLPALRLACPDLFLSPVPEAGRWPAWRAWAGLPLLWLLCSSYAFDGFSLPQLSYLFVPLAGWWAHKFGRAGRPAFLLGAGPLLLSYSAGPLFIGGAVGVFIAAVIVYRLVVDDDYRAATLNARAFGLRQGAYLLLVAAATVFVPGSGSPVTLGGGWQAYLFTLLLLLGLVLIEAPPRRLGWALAVGLVYGYGMRWIDKPAWPLFDWVGVGYSLNDPAVLLGALLALHGPNWLLWRKAQAVLDSLTPAELARPDGIHAAVAQHLAAPALASVLSLPYGLLALGFADVYFGLALDWRGPISSISLLGTSGLMALAFLIGLFDGASALRRVGLVLLPLVVVAAALNLAAGELVFAGQWAGLLRYSVSAINAVQAAVVVLAYVWLGGRAAAAGVLQGPVARRLGAPAPQTLAAPAAGLSAPPALLPQLRFDYMDLLLMAGLASLLLLRTAGGLAPVVAPLLGL